METPQPRPYSHCTPDPTKENDMTSRQPLSALLVTLTASLALGACSRHDERSVQERVDATENRAQQQTAQARNDANRALDNARQATEDAGSKVANAVSDAAITAAINAQLARDPALDASKIDVDTAQGRVVLRGSAPDADAKDRAKRIALAVNGVSSVDNYLTVPKS
jgi:osmotically-inducible protein OsmY